jgi:hypothetical protein
MGAKLYDEKTRDIGLTAYMGEYCALSLNSLLASYWGQGVLERLMFFYASNGCDDNTAAWLGRLAD